MNNNSNRTKITVIENGPLIVEGYFNIKGVNGELLSEVDKTFLCRCGKSSKKPYCDGSHSK